MKSYFVLEFLNFKDANKFFEIESLEKSKIGNINKMFLDTIGEDLIFNHHQE